MFITSTHNPLPNAAQSNGSRRSPCDLAEAIDGTMADTVSLEDAHRHNDLALLGRLRSTRVILGVVDISSTRIEDVDQIAARLREALAHIDQDRLIVGPDCGLIMLDRATARAKLEALVKAAKSI